VRQIGKRRKEDGLKISKLNQPVVDRCASDRSISTRISLGPKGVQLVISETGAHSDAFVGVQHDAEGAAAHGTGRQVLGELGADEAVVAVAGDNFAPDSLVAGFSLCVLRFVDIGDALSVVEDGVLAVIASVDLENGHLLDLGPLTTLKVQEGGLLVKSAHI
jgi:hypothetical protein